jgi:diaminopimelate epimerase
MQPNSNLIRFVKMTGSGNDFILIDNREQTFDPSRMPDLARLACRRKLSVGADGIIFIENDPRVDFQWRFYNADGSEAEMCGNGARCAARFALLQGIVSKTNISFRTLAGVIDAEIIEDRVKIKTSTPHGLQNNLHLDVDGKPFDLSFINTGVPHAVQLVASESELEAADVFHWGRSIRCHEHFQPAGSNANFSVVLDRHRMAVRTYERGVEAETLACGTGSIASVLVAAAKNLTASPVEVKTRSGEILTIYFDMQSLDGALQFSDVYLEGDAKVVYEANLWPETLTR